MWFSSVFDVRTTTVSGTKVLTTDQVTAAAQVPYGGPVESLDTGAIADRIEKALPRVARADVSTSFPHTVRIRITERVPVAAIKGGDGKFTQVDAGECASRRTPGPRRACPWSSSHCPPRAAPRWRSSRSRCW
ncbi:cell division protein FtsQ/DivIB [Streptacidiphilus monticola]